MFSTCARTYTKFNPIHIGRERERERERGREEAENVMRYEILQYYKSIAFSAAAQVVGGKCEYVPIDAIVPVKSSVMFSM